MSANEVEQKIKLNSSEYKAGLAQAAKEAERSMAAISRSVQQGGNDFQGFTDRAKKDGMSLTKMLGEMKSAFSGAVGKSLFMGGTAGLAASAGMMLGNQIKASAGLGLSFGSALQHMGARFGFDDEQKRDLEGHLLKQASTGTDLSALPEAAAALYGANGRNFEGMKQALPQIAAVSGSQKIDPRQLTEFLVNRLSGENRAIDSKNIESVLRSLYTSMNKGQFASISEAMAAFGGVGAGAKSRAGMSDQELAARAAGASAAGQTLENKVGALQAMTNLDDEAFGGSAPLRAFLGVKKDHREHLTMADFGTMSKTLNRQMQQGMRQQDLIGQFQSMGGMSKDQSEGLFAMLRDFDTKVMPSYRSAYSGFKTTSVDQNVDAANDSTSFRLSQLKNQSVALPLRTVNATTPEQRNALAALVTGGLPAAISAAIVSALSSLKVGVEVDSKDPAFRAKPKTTDHTRDPKGP
jgi:hypothetical protein